MTGVCEWRGTHLGCCLGSSKVDKGLGEALWTLGNDSARDPKRTKRADVLDEVEPRLCWGRSMTRGELEDTTWAALLSH